MAKDVSQYPVSFGYKAQDGKYYGPNGSVGLYHRGEDRAAPAGTPILVAGQKIGEVGKTGAASGNHLHFQCMKNGSDINPAPYRFKGGKVTRSGWHPQFGNHVRTDVGGIETIYAHMKAPSPVKVGQTIKSATINTMTDKEAHDVGTAAIRLGLHREPISGSEAQGFGRKFEDSTKKITPNSVMAGLNFVKNSTEWKTQDGKLKTPSNFTPVTEQLYKKG